MKNISLKENISKTIHVLKVIKMASKGYFYVFILQAVISSILPYISIFFSYLIIDGIVDGIPGSEIMGYAYLMIAINLFLGITNNLLNYYNKVYSVELQYNLDSKIASKTFNIDYSLLEDNETMKLIQMAEEGCSGNGDPKQYCEDVLSKLLSSVLSIFYGGFLLSGLLVVKEIEESSFLLKVLNNPFSVLIIVVALFIPALVSKYVMKKNNEKSYEIMMTNIEGNRQFSYFYQICSNYKYGKDIRLYHLQKMFISKLKTVRENADELWRDFSVFRSKLMSVSIFGNKLLSLVSYIFVGMKAMYGLISVGNVVAYVAAITIISQAITLIVERYSKVHLFNNYLDNYFKYLNLESTKEYGEISEIDINNLSIEFKDVSFRYPNVEEYTLKNINLKIDAGQKLAIVGMNGAGKTTLVKLLCRLFEPTEGEILVNNIPLKSYSKEVCENLFSVVFQDFKLFSYSIKDNVSSGLNGDANKVHETLSKTGLSERVDKMPKSIDTIIYQRSKENGVEISGGEAQKLAISRALYKDSGIVILDEPTAALDPKAEADIYEKFNTLVYNKTALFISHRMSSCKFCDEVIVIDKGEIIEKGHHDLLVNAKGLYNKMWTAQAKYYSEA
ncbi:ABC transporter ATP-binding protein [Candidatus Izimaplasma bacterium ZiA1]|uniref:ABC transporter ATP-binding protein n=1 Tax=Candidatus Izimoplasma sp. ZiA1 TaxID=2024899 RepID=UPI001439B8C9